MEAITTNAEIERELNSNLYAPLEVDEGATVEAEQFADDDEMFIGDLF